MFNLITSIISSVIITITVGLPTLAIIYPEDLGLSKLKELKKYGKRQFNDYDLRFPTIFKKRLSLDLKICTDYKIVEVCKRPTSLEELEELKRSL